MFRHVRSRNTHIDVVSRVSALDRAWDQRRRRRVGVSAVRDLNLGTADVELFTVAHC